MAEIAAVKPQPRTIEILHPATDDPIGLRVTIVSMDDDRCAKIKRSILDQRLEIEKKGKRFKADDVEANTQVLLFTATTGWEWYNPSGAEGDEGYDADAMPSFEGEQPQFNQRNFKRVTTALPWIADQINEAIGDRKAFFDNSKPI